MRMALAVIAALLGVPAAPAAPAAEPRFRVSITSRLVERRVIDAITVAYPAYGQGCTVARRADMTRTIDVWTERPVARTLKQLLVGGDANNFVELAGREVRNGSNVENEMPAGCTRPAHAPHHVDPTGTCGERRLRVEARGVGVGFVDRGRDNRFRFFYSRLGSDPYEGGCLPGLARGTINFLPFTAGGLWAAPQDVRVDLARLKAGKAVVARFADTARLDLSGRTGRNPDDYARDIEYIEWTASYEVRIDPVR